MRDAKGQRINEGFPRVGLRNVGSYQVSGHPYLTGSAMAANQTMRVQFPYVTKKVTVIASGSSAAGFAAHGGGIRICFTNPVSSSRSDESVPGVVDGHHYIHLDSHEDSFDFDVKCTEIYVQSMGGAAGFQLYASLTNIPTGSMYDLMAPGVPTDGLIG